MEAHMTVGLEVLRRVSGHKACRLTYALHTGLQRAVRSRSQAGHRGLTPSTSWSLWVYHGHLCDMEPKDSRQCWLESLWGSPPPSSAHRPRLPLVWGGTGLLHPVTCRTAERQRLVPNLSVSSFHPCEVAQHLPTEKRGNGRCSQLGKGLK